MPEVQDAETVHEAMKEMALCGACLTHKDWLSAMGHLNDAKRIINQLFKQEQDARLAADEATEYDWEQRQQLETGAELDHVAQAELEIADAEEAADAERDWQEYCNETGADRCPPRE